MLFLQRKNYFPDYIITKDGLQTDPAKIEKVVNSPLPTTVANVKSFIGLASYYCYSSTVT